MLSRKLQINKFICTVISSFEPKHRPYTPAHNGSIGKHLLKLYANRRLTDAHETIIRGNSLVRSVEALKYTI